MSDLLCFINHRTDVGPAKDALRIRLDYAVILGVVMAITAADDSELPGGGRSECSG